VVERWTWEGGDLGERWSGQAVRDNLKADEGKQIHDHGQEVQRSAMINNDRAPRARIALTATDGVL
jgi:hypothetical protein